ncbi:MAG: M20 family metallo-hydrolase, partial [Deltaproteobacteria bacterium]
MISCRRTNEHRESDMSGNTDLDKVLGLLEGWRDEMVQVQVELVKRPALGPDNGGAGEWERARYLEQLVRGWGLSVEHLDAPDERVAEGTRPNLVVRLAGDKTSPAVWVMAHMDVVPAGPESEWKTPPFEAVVKDGRIFGRGVEDNQQGLVSSLFALRALKEANVTPPTDVALLLVSDEETGNRYGIEYVLENRPDLVGPSDIVVVPDSGNSDGTMLEVAEKTILWVKFVIEGKQVHASMPQLGLNAHRVSAMLVCRLDEELRKKFSGTDPVFDPPSSTFEPTKREANVDNVNTIPGKEVLFFDCRI